MTLACCRVTAGSDVSPTRMMEQQQKIAALVMKDPAVESVVFSLAAASGGGGGSGQLYISLKLLADRAASRPSYHDAPGTRWLATRPACLRLRPVQDPPELWRWRRQRTGRLQYQSRWLGNDIATLQEGRRSSTRWNSCQKLRDVGKRRRRIGPR